MDDCHSLREKTLIYGDFVKAFLVALGTTDEAEQNPMLAASASVAREHFETLQKELDRVWELYQRTHRRLGSAS
jgi:hypothetical protein